MTRTYTTESERQAALAEAKAEYARTGVFHTPMPAALAEHEARRHGPAPFGVRRPDARPTPASGVSAEQVAAVVREATATLTDHAALSYAARTLREAGATDSQVTEAMRRVQDERDRQRQRDGGW
jgi:hypothetical protein